MIAIVKEEDDLAADLLLQPARRRNLGVEKSFGEKSARLLAEADDRLAHGECRLLVGWPALGRDGALRRPLGRQSIFEATLGPQPGRRRHVFSVRAGCNGVA